MLRLRGNVTDISKGTKEVGRLDKVTFVHQVSEELTLNPWSDSYESVIFLGELLNLDFLCEPGPWGLTVRITSAVTYK